MPLKRFIQTSGNSYAGLAFFLVPLAGLIFSIAAMPSSQKMGSERCSACHEDLSQAFLLSPHAGAKDGCTSCHGQAERHIEEGSAGTIFAFQPSDLPAEKSVRCLSCHVKDSPHYAASPHGKASLDCTTCHSVHAEKLTPHLLRTSAEQNCLACHQDIFAEFKLNERHRLEEGILSCTSCHNPHEPAERGRIGGFQQEACLKCHTDKGGPYIYEHLASRVEGCATCHEVHGSPNRHLLKFQNSADLCFSCHVAAPAWHSRFTSMGTNCVTCHTAIHGSNLSRLFLK